MNNNYNRLKRFFDSLREHVKEGYSIDRNQIYNFLSVYDLPSNERSLDLEKVRDTVVENVKNQVENLNEKAIKSSKVPNVNSFNVLEQSSFRHINTTFKCKQESGCRDLIKVYLPVNNMKLEKVSTKVYIF